MKQRIKQRKGLFNWFTILLVIIIGYFAVILVKQQIYLNGRGAPRDGKG